MRAYEEKLLGLVAALDMKEHNTQRHSQRVRQNTLLLADRFGIDEAKKKAIGLGALLHDVGKIAVPDAILLKPAQLTDDEQNVMLQTSSSWVWHCKPDRILREAADIVHAHHERFDGFGYPQGLKGEAIPLGARLFAVVDVYDALTSTRPYRTPLSHEDALVEIRKESGRHFDPQSGGGIPDHFPKRVE